MTRFKNAKRQHDIISKSISKLLRVTCSKLYDFSCLRRFQFSEIEYAKYPSPFIFFSDPPLCLSGFQRVMGAISPFITLHQKKI